MEWNIRVGEGMAVEVDMIRWGKKEGGGRVEVRNMQGTVGWSGGSKWPIWSRL